MAPVQMRANEYLIPPALYRGCGWAWAVVDDTGRVLGLEYMDNYAPARLEDLGRVRFTASAREALAAENSRRFETHRKAARGRLVELMVGLGPGDGVRMVKGMCSGGVLGAVKECGWKPGWMAGVGGVGWVGGVGGYMEDEMERARR